MLPFKTVVKFIWFGQWHVPCHTINIVRKASRDMYTRDMYTSRILSYIYHTPITPLSSNHLLKIAWMLPKLGLPLDHHWFPYFKKALTSSQEALDALGPTLGELTTLWRFHGDIHGEIRRCGILWDI